MITRLRLERKKQRMKAVELASRSGVAAPVISKLENGHERMFPAYKDRLAKALNLSEEEADRLLDPVDEEIEMLLR